MEYILVLAAVLVALIVAAQTFIKPAAERTLNQSGNVLQRAANRVSNGLRGL